MKNSLVLIFMIFCLISCNQKKEHFLGEPNNRNRFLNYKEELKNRKSSKNKINKENKNDTLVIDSKCAIIYEPTEKSIERRKKEVGEENFYIGADDYLFYLDESITYLESQKINVVTTKNDKVLKFISTDKNVVIIKLELEKEIWGIYLFDPIKKPKKISVMAIDEGYKEYIK